MKFYRHEFTVRSRFPFPVDMLRYDACYPKGSDDAHAILRSIEVQGTPDIHSVTLVAIKDRRQWEPTVERWRSFLWSVDPESIKHAPVIE